jgi:hypothetical protein
MPYTVDDLCSGEGIQHTFGYLLTVVDAHTTITYGEIAARLAADLQIEGKVFPTHIGDVVGTLMHSILEVNETAPLINVLVVNQGTGEPGEGADGFLRDRFNLPNRDISDKRRHELVAQAAEKVYAFRNWPQLYYQLFGEQAPVAEGISLIKGDEEDGIPPAPSHSGWHGGGPAESEEHKKLKKYVLHHPKKVHAPSEPDDARMELMLLSGDEVDVYFARGDAVHLVEVKSIRSTEPDFIRGVFQCIKYRAVFQAQRAGTMSNIRITATLVTEHDPSSYICELAKRHDVRLVVLPVNRILNG